MSVRPPGGATPSPERLNFRIKNAEPERVARPPRVVSVYQARSDRSDGRESASTARPSTVVSIDPGRPNRSVERESAPRPDNVRSDALRREFAKMKLNEVADVAARNESSAHFYAARVEMDRRVAQAQIAAAIAQRDAANTLRMTSLTAFLLVPGALLSGVLGWLLFKLLRVG